jgi:hypothetical protein
MRARRTVPHRDNFPKLTQKAFVRFSQTTQNASLAAFDFGTINAIKNTARSIGSELHANTCELWAGAPGWLVDIEQRASLERIPAQRGDVVSAGRGISRKGSRQP